MKTSITKNKKTKKHSIITEQELQELQKLSDKKLIQYYKDFKWEIEFVLSCGKYEFRYLGLIEKELSKRNLI